ncbi:MAG: hypothetical protein COA82_06805 [Alkaliphilus sp.]|nr:NTP transferase domain-containing protein [bacterium AH-315-L21]PHS34793.1 MAG: hypothetical protein COA82_06805 [Alkaliphilus sp.]
MITAIIMAAGFSKRMKRKSSINNCDELHEKNKLLIRIKGKSLLENTLDVVNGIDFHERILVYKDEAIKQKAKEMGFKTVFNETAQNGISSSLKLGILNAKPTDAYMFFVADQPLLSVKTIKRLIEKKTGDGSLSESGEAAQKTIFVPKYNNKPGMPVIFLVKWREELLKIEGDIGGREIIKKNRGEVLLIDIENRYDGLDIDTWEDYEVIRKNEHIQ